MAEQRNIGGRYYHSDPEVVPDSAPDPEVVPESAPERVPFTEKPGILVQDHKQLPRRPRDRICGLRPVLFWLLILLMVVILAGAIGGGVGGGLAARPSSSATKQSDVSTSTSIPSTASSTSSAASATPTYQFSSGCPATNGTTYAPINVEASNSTYQVNGTDLNYLILCDTNFASSDSSFNPSISDLQVLYNVPTIQDCITQCASYNFALTTVTNPPWSLLCSGIAYASPEATSSDTVKCFLKSGVRNDAVNVPVSGQEDSAVLQWVGE